MLKILLTINDISITGGAERVCVNLANALNEAGHQVSILSFYQANTPLPYELDDSVNLHIWHNLSEAEYAKKQHSNLFSKIYYKNFYKFFLSLRVLKAYGQQDIILVSDWTFSPFFRHKQCQYIKVQHSVQQRYAKRNNLFDTIIFLASSQANTWQNYHKNIKVIPNFLPFISNKNTDSNQHRIISVGRLSEEKGFLRLIDIWEKVQERINEELESTPLEQVQNVRVQNSETLESNPCSTNSPHCHTERSETSKNLESKKDISPFLKARTIRKDFAHTCKYDNITIQNDNHEKNLDSKQISAKTATHKKDLESWELIIVGDGVMKEQIQAKILEKNLQDTIILKPFTKDIESEYLNASIYAMTSHFEGFGMVLVEASSYALPCIAFDIAAGPSDIIESNTSGYLIQDNDLQGYANKLIELMSNKEKRESMGLQAKQRVKEKFSKEAIMPLWEEVFREGR
nr:glycosyltransferase family 4 protein [uncultured Helicobacter sp.]